MLDNSKVRLLGRRCVVVDDRSDDELENTPGSFDHSISPHLHLQTSTKLLTTSAAIHLIRQLKFELGRPILSVIPISCGLTLIHSRLCTTTSRSRYCITRRLQENPPATNFNQRRRDTHNFRFSGTVTPNPRVCCNSTRILEHRIS